MDTQSELAVLRQLLKVLQSGDMTLHQHGKDVTPMEVEKLKPDIAFLEKVLARRQ